MTESGTRAASSLGASFYITALRGNDTLSGGCNSVKIVSTSLLNKDLFSNGSRRGRGGGRGGEGGGGQLFRFRVQPF